jgi:hypothetical protein
VRLEELAVGVWHGGAGDHGERRATVDVEQLPDFGDGLAVLVVFAAMVFLDLRYELADLPELLGCPVFLGRFLGRAAPFRIHNVLRGQIKVVNLQVRYGLFKSPDELSLTMAVI